MGFMLKTALITVGTMLAIPFSPDFGIQLALAFAIGMILPRKVINPVDSFLLKIPLLKHIQNFMSSRFKKHRVKTLVPRIIVGYLFTYVVGGVCLAISLWL